MLRLWKEGHDVVYAVRRKRSEGPGKRLAYRAFYRVLSMISEVEIPLDSGDFCLMDRRIVDTLNRLPEKGRFVRGLRSFLGFRQVRSNTIARLVKPDVPNIRSTSSPAWPSMDW